MKGTQYEAFQVWTDGGCGCRVGVRGPGVCGYDRLGYDRGRHRDRFHPGHYGWPGADGSCGRRCPG